MATVADKYPTPSTSSFWTPGCENQQDQREEVLQEVSEACPKADIVRSATVGVDDEGDAIVQEGSGGGVSHGCLGVSSTDGGNRDGVSTSSTASPGEPVEQVN